jgi:ubiquinol-cytochrome c reductase cytochrome b subunit
MNTPAKLRVVLDWLDEGTGLCSGLRQCAERTERGCPWLNRWWPGAIVFTFVVQVITGLVLWMHYSPSAQTAWESVYFIQYQLAGGWFVRGVHHYAGQVLVALTGLYAFQRILSGVYRHPREFVFWAAVCMFLASLGLCLTGDLLSWDQDRYSATQTRVSFAMLLPVIGGHLYKLVAGGPAFGHLTLTRFFALHVSVLAGGFGLLLVIHAWLVRRARQVEETAGGPEPAGSSTSCCSSRFAQHAVVGLVVLAVILLLVFQNAFRGGHTGQPAGQYLGAELGAPADPDPANAYAAARPEWSFRGLYVFTHFFSGAWQMVPIFVVPSLVLLYVFAMPLIAVRRPGHAVNVAVTLVLAAGLVYLSYKSYRDDYGDPDYLAAVEQGRQTGERVIALARSQGIPPSGALSLLLNDPQLQGPKLFDQHCGSCHAYTPAAGKAIAPAEQSAPELFQFAHPAWIAGLLDPKQIKSDKYFGNTRFAGSLMVKYLESHKLDQEQRDAIAAALSAEAHLKSSAAAANDERLVANGRKLIVSEGCTRCHRFHEQGVSGDAPDLTGYGSREWLTGVIADPAHDWFYSVRNDRMPAYVQLPEEPAKNRLSFAQTEVLVSWLRGEWHEPSGEKPSAAAASTEVILGKWEARRSRRLAEPPKDARGKALAVLELAQCAVCHDCADEKGQGIRCRQPVAPTLFRFAGAEWLRGMLDPEQVAGPRFFGTNDKFKDGKMVEFVRDNLPDNIADAGESQLDALLKKAASESKQVEFALQNLPELKKKIGEEALRKQAEQAVKDNKFAEFVKEHAGPLTKQLGQQKLDALIAALAAGAQQDEAGDGDADVQELFETLGCADCHKYYDAGDLGSAPDMTGYGSREWLAAIIANPEHKRFYGKRNDGMPAYLLSADKPQRNLLTAEQIQALADLLRGKLDSR